MSISSLLSQLVDIFRNWSHDTPEPYVLPAATTTTLGGVKVGDNLTVAEDGTLSGAQEIEEIKFRVIGGTTPSIECNKTPAEIHSIMNSGKKCQTFLLFTTSSQQTAVIKIQATAVTYRPDPELITCAFTFITTSEAMTMSQTHMLTSSYDSDTNEWSEWTYSRESMMLEGTVVPL